MYEPSWRHLSVTSLLGDTSDITRVSGIKRISKLRELPTLRARFHTLFAQDPMHDFAEGVLGWFIQRAFAEFNTTQDRCDAVNARLEAVKKTLSASLRWPTLNVSELRGESWKINGTYTICAHKNVLISRLLFVYLYLQRVRPWGCSSVYHLLSRSYTTTTV